MYTICICNSAEYMNIRFDFVFSYWIFLWYLLYEWKFTQYNPKFALAVGLIENLLYLLCMIFYKNSIVTIWLFVIVNFFIKILPLYMVIETTVRKSDIVFSFALFCVYMIWLIVNRVNLYKNVKDPLKIFRDNETDKTPMVSIIRRVVYYVKN